MKKVTHYLKTLFLISSSLLLASCSTESNKQPTVILDNNEEKEIANTPEETTTPNDSGESNSSSENKENENVNNTEEKPNENKPEEKPNNQDQPPVVENVYAINHSTATLKMGEELQLSITNNGINVNNITWTSSDSDLARVDDNGLVRACFFTNENEVVTITGNINNTKSLKCDLTINPRTESIFQKVYYRSQTVNQDEDGHVIYMFVHAGVEANGTINVNKTFEYDSYTNICRIKVIKSFVEGNVTAYYVGRNDFYWGDYENGLFYGQYSEIYNNQEKDALFSFSKVGISYSEHTIFISSNTTYSILESDWSSITDEAMVAKGVFYRIEECVEYAEQKFEEYNYGVHLF